MGASCQGEGLRRDRVEMEGGADVLYINSQKSGFSCKRYDYIFFTLQYHFLHIPDPSINLLANPPHPLVLRQFIMSMHPTRAILHKLLNLRPQKSFMKAEIIDRSDACEDCVGVSGAGTV